MSSCRTFVTLKSILNPDDEVIVFKPYFAEYGFYVMHAQGNLKVADCDESFMPDIDSFMRTATSRTKAVIINTPIILRESYTLRKYC